MLRKAPTNICSRRRSTAHSSSSRETKRRVMASAALTSASSSRSTAGSLGSPVPVTAAPIIHYVPSKSVASSKGDTCGCSANGSPRSCGDCLNVELQSGEQCFVNPLGICVNAKDVEYYRLYFNSVRTVGATTTSGSIPFANEYFSSSNTTYCTIPDSKCLQCRAQWMTDVEKDSLQSTKNFLCVGESGCICTAYCELRASSNVTVPSSLTIGSNEACYSSQFGWSMEYSAAVALARNVMMLFGGALMIVLAVRMGVGQFHQSRYNRRMRERRRALREQRNGVHRSDMMLTLEGWNGYREQLIGREQENLGLKTEPLLTEEPTRAVVEEGEGFRPASPSQLPRHQSAPEN